MAYHHIQQSESWDELSLTMGDLTTWTLQGMAMLNESSKPQLWYLSDQAGEDPAARRWDLDGDLWVSFGMLTYINYVF